MVHRNGLCHTHTVKEVGDRVVSKKVSIRQPEGGILVFLVTSSSVWRDRDGEEEFVKGEPRQEDYEAEDEYGGKEEEAFESTVTTDFFLRRLRFAPVVTATAAT